MAKMSAAARKRISQAQKKRWAAYRAARRAGRPARSRQSRSARRKRSSMRNDNPFLDMSVSELAQAKGQLEDALERVRALVA